MIWYLFRTVYLMQPAHIKSVLTGSSITVPISGGKLALGTWQGIYLCEFRTSSHRRTLVATIQGE